MKILITLFCLTLILSLANASDKIRYDNYKVYTAIIKNDEQYKFLKSFENEPENFSIWCSSQHGTQSHMEIMVSPKKNSEFKELLKVNSIKAEIKIENVQELIDQESNSLSPFSFSWENYYPLSEINGFLDFIAGQYPEVVTQFTIGKSYEGRDIRGLKISYKSGNPGIFIESHIHAREWITSATATYLAYELLYSNRSDIREMAENIDWYIIPNINPDGFVYSREKDRMWRKTRQPHNTSSCIGVDGNRNFDSHWMENGGASSNPCAETYAGPKPFSEPEMKALADYYGSIKDKISIFLSFHSYGQVLLSPFGHTTKEFPSNYNDMQAVAKATTEALKKRHNTSYRYGSTATVLYVASGVSPDWAYNTQGTRLAYTFEFRDSGRYGFILPPDQIVPNAQEAVDGIVAMTQEARKLKYL